MMDKTSWTRVRFGEVVRLNKDRVADPAAAGIERYVGIEHIEPEDLRIRKWGLVAEGTTFTNYFKPGQVLFVKRRAYQRKVALADFEGVCSGDIYVLESRDPDVLLPELLPFICQTDAFFEHAVRTSAGSLSPRTNWKQLADYEFALPPLAEQRRIAEVLKKMIETGEAIQSSRNKLQIMKDAVIKARSAMLERHGLRTFQTIVDRIDSGKSPSGRPEPAKEGEFGVLKVSAVSDWIFVPTENKSIASSDYSDQFEVRRGDFLAIRANADPHSVGRTCIVTETPAGLMLSDKTWRIVFKPNNPYSKIGILAWTKSPSFRTHILKHLAGTDAKNISQNKFLNGPFPACSPEEFNNFAHEIEIILSAETVLRTRQDGLRKLFKKYLSEMVVL